MQTQLIAVLTAVASVATATMAFSAWTRLRKGARNRTLTVTNKANGKTATLPRDYSPAAVEQLLELTA